MPIESPQWTLADTSTFGLIIYMTFVGSYPRDPEPDLVVETMVTEKERSIIVFR